MIPYQNQNPNYYQQQYLQPQYPYQNPYMDRINQLQQYQQSLQQPQQMQIQPQPQSQFATLGKIVESIDMVKATDIPMDGNMYYFPKADGTEVYGKRWLPTGQTAIEIYEPTNKENKKEESNLEFKEIKEKIYEIIEAMGIIQLQIKELNQTK